MSYHRHSGCKAHLRDRQRVLLSTIGLSRADEPPIASTPPALLNPHYAPIHLVVPMYNPPNPAYKPRLHHKILLSKRPSNWTAVKELKFSYHSMDMW